MTQTIWKTTLQVVDMQTVQLPRGAEILCAREQFEDVCLWFKCDPKEPPEQRKIFIYPTGGAAPTDARYLGTVSLMGGNLIYHVFE